MAPDASESFQPEQEYVDFIYRKMKEAYDAARAANQEATDRLKMYHARRLQQKYKRPYEISTILGTNALIGPPGRGKAMWVHLNHLKRMIPRTLPEFHYEEGAARIEP